MSGTLAILVIGRVLLITCSIISIRFATSLLGPIQMGAMNLVLSAVNLFALLVGAFSLFFYRQVVEWDMEGRLLQNIGRYGRFLVIAAAVACGVMLVATGSEGSPWRTIPAYWLVLLLGGNLVIATLNGAVLHCLNVMGRRVSYVLLSNVASWGGVGLAVVGNLGTSPRAEHWLAGLLCGQLVSLLIAFGVLMKRLRESSQSAGIVVEARTADFRFSALWRFSWPLLICTGLYWVQRSSFAPLMASTSGVRTLGLFSVAFSVGLLVMSSFDTLFREYYSPIYYKGIAGDGDDKKIAAWEDFADALFPAIVAMFVFVSAVGTLLLRVLVSNEFHGMGSIVAWGALSQALISVYSLYMLLASSFMDNRVLLMPNLVGAFTVVALLVLLLPTYPMMGAGIAINAGLLMTTCLAAHRLRKVHRLRFPARRMAIALILALPFGVVPWLDEAFVSMVKPSLAQVIVMLLIAGTYAIALQHRLASHWLRRAH